MSDVNGVVFQAAGNEDVCTLDVYKRQRVSSRNGKTAGQKGEEVQRRLLETEERQRAID